LPLSLPKTNFSLIHSFLIGIKQTAASYWDWLPLEIKEHIILFVESQQAIDERNEATKKSLHTEMAHYHQVEAACELHNIHHFLASTFGLFRQVT